MYFGVLLHFLLISIYRCYYRLLFWISSGLMSRVPFQWTTCDDGMIFLALPVKKKHPAVRRCFWILSGLTSISRSFSSQTKVVAGGVIILPRFGVF